MPHKTRILNGVRSLSDLKNAEYGYLLSALVLLILGLFTRFYHLGEGALVGDELITFRESANRLWTLFNPGYYWLTELSKAIFKDPEFLTRLPSAILNVVSIPVFFLIWRRVAGDLSAFMGALLLVFLEWHLFHGQYGRFFSGVLLFSLLSYFYYWTAVENGSISCLIASIVTGFLAFLFHFTALIVLATSVLFSGLLLLTHRFREIKPAWALETKQLRVVKIHFLVSVLGALLLLPAALHMFGAWTARGEFTGAVVWLRRFVVALGSVGILTAGLGWLILFQKHARLALFLFVSTGIPVVLAFFGAEFIRVRDDYVFYIISLIALCSGVFVKQLFLSTSGLVRAGIVVLIPALMFPSFISHYTDRATLDIREVVAFLEKEIAESDQILEYAIEFRHYAEGRLPVKERLGPRWGNHPDWPSALDSLTKHSNKTWIVLRTSRRGNPSVIENWLLENARLVWRKSAVRWDYSSRGYEVWLVDTEDFRVAGM